MHIRKKLALIDHSFHRKSNSSKFLAALLSRHYEVAIFWDAAWEGGPGVDVNEIARQEFDILVVHQMFSLFRPRDLKATGCRNIVLIPMYDSQYDKPDLLLLRYHAFKFLNFSKTLENKMREYGLRTRYLQYFPPVPETANTPRKPEPGRLKGFFWQRTSDITWNTIRQLIKNPGFAGFHLHCATDPPGYPVVLPGETDKKQWDFSFSEWFEDWGDYLAALEKADVYFAPRPCEGIGMPVIEAMGMGKCVVAPDCPTMNEYITHGETGLLYDMDRPEPLDFSDVERISENARQFALKGRQQWEKAEQAMIDFMEADMPLSVHRKARLTLLHFRHYAEWVLSRIRHKLRQRL